jgi:hypothetical protein
MPIHPLIEIGRAQKKEDVLAGLERWKVRHPEAAALVEPADVLVDSMRGRFQSWWRIRVNLQHVPEDKRPAQESLDPDDEPKVSWPGADDPKMMEEFRRWRSQTSTARRKAKKAEEAEAAEAAETVEATETAPSAPAGGRAAVVEAPAAEAPPPAAKAADASEAPEANAAAEVASAKSPRRRPSRARKPS